MPVPSDNSSPVEQRNSFSLHDDLVERDLLNPDRAVLFEEQFGASGYRELRDLAAQVSSRAVRGGPRVLILPGIMGSKLGIPHDVFDDVLWFNPVQIAVGKLTALRLNGADGYRAVGVILLAYLKLKFKLRLAGFDADFHPFDWRRSLADTGAELAARIAAEPRPVSLVGHSMGGLAARAALAKGAAVQKIIQLGTPNRGSFAPVQVLRATYDTVLQIAKLDLIHDARQLCDGVFKTFPGLYEMLPFSDTGIGIDLFSPASWPDSDPRPVPERLAAAHAFQQALPLGDARFFLVAGVNQSTVTGIRREPVEFVYSVSNEGDGTVPLAFARLAGIPDAQTYYVEESHGSLPNNDLVETAVCDLLARGATEALPRVAPPMRRDAAQLRESQVWVQGIGMEGAATAPTVAREMLRAVAAPDARPVAAPALAKAAAAAAGAGVMTAPAERAAETLRFQHLLVSRRRQHQLDLRIARGSITQVESRAYVLGMFQNVAPSGAARAIDARLRGAVSEFTARRMFTSAVGEIFTLPVGRNAMRADMVLFAGLGRFDEFGPEVQQMVAENVIRVLSRTRVEEFATVLMGGATIYTVGTLLQSLLSGFFRGLKDADRENRFRSITLCETDPRRMEEIKRELYRLSSTALFDDVEVMLDEIELEPEEPAALPGARAAARAPEPVYLLCRQQSVEDGSLLLRSSVLSASARATLVTETAEINAAELDEQLRDLEQVTAGPAVGLEALGEQLAATVLSPSVRSELLRSSGHHLVVVHDAPCSRIPWETLRIRSSNGDSAWTPAADAGLSHRLDVDDLPVATWPEQKRYQPGMHILLIVDPRENLPGAVREGQRLTELASLIPGLTLKKLTGRQATCYAVLQELRSGEYEVVHYAGHAGFNEANPASSGLLLADGMLRGADLSNILALPSLVFCNACETGRLRRGSAELEPEQAAVARAADIGRSFAIAETVLRGGIANYLGTYWSVNDDAAMRFSEQLYQALLTGACLGDAIQKGRAAVRAAGSNDWADYVFYGSYDFNLKVPGA